MRERFAAEKIFSVFTAIIKGFFKFIKLFNIHTAVRFLKHIQFHPAAVHHYLGSLVHKLNGRLQAIDKSAGVFGGIAPQHKIPRLFLSGNKAAFHSENIKCCHTPYICRNKRNVGINLFRIVRGIIPIAAYLEVGIFFMYRIDVMAPGFSIFITEELQKLGIMRVVFVFRNFGYTGFFGKPCKYFGSVIRLNIKSRTVHPCAVKLIIPRKLQKLRNEPFFYVITRNVQQARIKRSVSPHKRPIGMSLRRVSVVHCGMMCKKAHAVFLCDLTPDFKYILIYFGCAIFKSCGVACNAVSSLCIALNIIGMQHVNNILHRFFGETFSYVPVIS